MVHRSVALATASNSLASLRPAAANAHDVVASSCRNTLCRALYRAYMVPAASPEELNLAKIVLPVKYQVILQIEAGKMISVVKLTHPKPSRSPI